MHLLLLEISVVVGVFFSALFAPWRVVSRWTWEKNCIWFNLGESNGFLPHTVLLDFVRSNHVTPASSVNIWSLKLLKTVQIIITKKKVQPCKLFNRSFTLRHPKGDSRRGQHFSGFWLGEENEAISKLMKIGMVEMTKERKETRKQYLGWKTTVTSNLSASRRWNHRATITGV